jgi:hypothetical protein
MARRPEAEASGYQPYPFDGADRAMEARSGLAPTQGLSFSV